MEVIYKYPLEFKGFQEIELPQGYEILDIHVQNGIPCIWALVDTGNKLVKTDIHMYATGDTIKESDLEYVGTIHLLAGQAVFHVFRR